MPEQQESILIVDDSPDNIRVLNNVLRSHYKLSAASSGEKAMALARRTPPPNLILLDIMMPEMDGYELCRHLKADPDTARIPIIFVTARTEAADEAKGLQVGAVDYITKPICPQILLARVQTHLKLRSLVLELRRLATTDELTGCHNRRHFLQQGEIELLRHKRYHHPMALLMLDIDHFKKVNDVCGHAVGDRALKKLAEAVSGNLRSSDLFARIGGEEFVVLLPETDTALALTIAERLRASLRMDISDKIDPMSVSIGVVELAEQDSTLDDLLRYADQALYQAKEEGRDRVVLWKSTG
jgi:diguanylate cyclase (GGDEF)-like protein